MKTVALRRRHGRVIYLNRVWGRIARADNGRRVFFHINQTDQHFVVGDYVSFVEGFNSEWGEHAADIKPEAHA